MDQLARFLRDLRQEGIEIPEDIIDDVLGDCFEDNTTGKARTLYDRRIPGGYPFNSIPGQPGYDCHSLLVVRCYDKDNLHERLREMIYHA